MATDNDLLASMPEPPPPRPARREAAIQEALRRFDGAREAAPARPGSTRPASMSQGWGRPQIAVLASAALVVLVSVPIWWTEKDGVLPDVPQAPRPIAQNPPGEAPAPQARAPQQTVPPVTPPVSASTAPPDVIAADAKSLSQGFDEVSAKPVSAPAPPSPEARPAAPAEASDRAIVVTGSRI